MLLRNSIVSPTHSLLVLAVEALLDLHPYCHHAKETIATSASLQLHGLHLRLTLQLQADCMHSMPAN